MAAEKERLAKEAGRLEQVGRRFASLSADSFVLWANRRVAPQSWLRTSFVPRGAQGRELEQHQKRLAAQDSPLVGSHCLHVWQAIAWAACRRPRRLCRQRSALHAVHAELAVTYARPTLPQLAAMC